MDSQQMVALGTLRLRLRLVERFARSDHLFIVLIPNDPLAFESFEYFDRDLLVHCSTPQVQRRPVHPLEFYHDGQRKKTRETTFVCLGGNGIRSPGKSDGIPFFLTEHSKRL